MSKFLCFAALLVSASCVLADRVVLEDRFDSFHPTQKLTAPATGPRGSFGDGGTVEGGQKPSGLALKGFGAVMYRIGGAVNADKGVLEMEFTVRFTPNREPTVEEQATNAATRTLVTLFVPGGRISASVDPGTNPQLCLSVYEHATTAHLFLKRLPIEWKEGEKHRLTISWGDYLRFAVDGKKVASTAFRGLHGPWGLTKFTDDNAIVVFGSLKNWVNTYGDITLHHVTITEPTLSTLENVAAAAGVPGAKFQPNTLTIPRVSRAPAIDGTLADGEWDQAAALTGLTDVSQMADMKQATTFYLGYDDRNLYLACRCYRTQAETTDAACFARDGFVFMDDAIELYLMPAGGKDHIQFIGNSFGTIYDALNRNPDWNGNWQFKTRAEDTCWTGELTIPFAELKRSAPADGETWAVNLCRDLPEMSGFGSWSFLKGSFDQPEKFAQAVFTGSGPAVRVLAITGTQYADPVLTGEVALPADAAAVAGEIKGDVWLYDDSSVLAHRSLTAGGKDGRKFSVPLKPEAAAAPAEGEFFISYLFTDASGKRLLSGNYPFSTMPTFALATAMYPSRDEVDITFDLKGMRIIPDGTTARASLLDATKKVLAVATAKTVTAEGSMIVTLPLRDVTPAAYTVLGELLTKDNRVLQSGRVQIEKKPAPWWQGKKAGVSEVVLPPWTPMSVKSAVPNSAIRNPQSAISVSCWGREVSFAGAILPAAIVSNGQDLLSGPISLTAVSGGQTYRLQQGECTVESAKPNEVHLTTVGTAGPFQAQAKIVLDYDGFIRIDLQLTGTPGTKLDQFSLEIPFKPERSILLHHSTGGSGYAGLAYDEPWVTAFLPMLWLGDDDRGLAWFCESNRGWNTPGNGEIELLPGKTSRLLRVNFIRQAITLNEPRPFTFGLMATPVKPVPDHFRKARLNNTADPGPITFTETLVYPAKGLLEPRRGSLQFFVQPTWPAAKAGVGMDSQELIHVSLAENGPSLSLRVQPDVAGESIRAIYTPAREPKSKTEPVKKVLLTGKSPFPAGMFHHVALSWGDALNLYVDGALVATLPQAGLMPDAGEVAESGRLIFGDTYPWIGRAAIIVDEFKISRAPLTPEEAKQLADQRPVADDNTLLLDRYDDEFRPEGLSDGVTVPERGAGGIPSIGCQFVPGKFGKAVAVQAAPAKNITDILVKDGKSDYLCDWSWNEHIGDPYPGKLADKFKTTVKAYQALGAKVYPYTINYLALRHPDHDYYINDWMAAPLRTWRYPADGENWRNYDGDACCPNSTFADYFLATYEKTLKEYDLDGVYIDGSSKPDRCMNERHGCGWRDETGTLRGIYPIFATRAFIKRLYTLVHLQRPDGILDNHMSFNLFIPTSSFSDIIYTGEHEPIFRLDMLRTRMAVGPWGLPVEGLGDSNHCFSERQWVYYALNGAVVRPQGTNARDDMQRKTTLIRDIIDEFRLAAGAKWLPYHDAASPFKPLTPDFSVSAWQRPDGQCLLILSNLGKTGPATGKIKLPVPAKSAINALTLRPLPVTDGILEVSCGFEQLRLVRVK